MERRNFTGGVLNFHKEFLIQQDLHLVFIVSNVGFLFRETLAFDVLALFANEFLLLSSILNVCLSYLSDREGHGH